MTAPCRRKLIEVAPPLDASKDDGAGARASPDPAPAPMERVWRHIEELGITEDDITDAVDWSRGQ